MLLLAQGPHARQTRAHKHRSTRIRARQAVVRQCSGTTSTRAVAASRAVVQPITPRPASINPATGFVPVTAHTVDGQDCPSQCRAAYTYTQGGTPNILQARLPCPASTPSLSCKHEQRASCKQLQQPHTACSLHHIHYNTNTHTSLQNSIHTGHPTALTRLR
jgi:hypothetical protein